MRQMHLLTTLALLLACTMSMWSDPLPNICPLPLLIEYAQNYTIATDDLKNLIKNNVSSLTYDSIKESPVTLSDIKATFSYLGGKTALPVSPFEVTVTDDKFQITIDLKAIYNKTFSIKAQTFTVVAKATVPVSYHKLFDTALNQFVISNVTYTFTNTSIVVSSYTPTPGSAQKKAIQDVINTNLVNAVNTTLKKLPQWLEDTAKVQGISTIYPDATYNYLYQTRELNYTLSINTKTQNLTSDEKGILSIKQYGSIIGQDNETCPQYTPAAKAPFRQFITISFIHNFIKQVAKTYPPYQAVLISKETIRTTYFQYRLVDLEFLLSGLDEYYQYYLNKITFTCKPNQVTYTSVGTQNVHSYIDWRCQGNLWTDDTKSVTILSGVISVSHRFSVRIDTPGQFTVHQDDSEVTGAKFDPVGTIIVKDTNLAIVYMKQFLNDLRTYTPGSQFKIAPQSTHFQYEPVLSENEGGIWVA